MASNSVRSTMIRMAVSKGIRDIRENAGRGVRNLAEMGKMFVKGQNLSEFFDRVVDVLQNEHNAYYKLVENIANTMGEDTLATFGINLGYNSLSSGAATIRKKEEELGFNIPWCVALDMGAGGPGALAGLDRIVGEGRALGVFTYPLVLQSGYAGFEELARFMTGRRDCAFILFTPPDVVTPEMCARVLRAQNAAVLLNIGKPGAEAAAGLLAHSGCVRGGFQLLEGLAPEKVGEEMLAPCRALDLPIFVCLRGPDEVAPRGDATYRAIARLRENLAVPVLPLDWYQDIAYADRVVSIDGCFARVEADGTLVATDAETGRAVRRDLKTMSLEEALRQALPKKRAEAGFAPA